MVSRYVFLSGSGARETKNVENIVMTFSETHKVFEEPLKTVRHGNKGWRYALVKIRQTPNVISQLAAVNN